jgi:hypothetical protein
VPVGEQDRQHGPDLDRHPQDTAGGALHIVFALRVMLLCAHRVLASGVG